MIKLIYPSSLCFISSGIQKGDDVDDALNIAFESKRTMLHQCETNNYFIFFL